MATAAPAKTEADFIVDYVSSKNHKKCGELVARAREKWSKGDTVLAPKTNTKAPNTTKKAPKEILPHTANIHPKADLASLLTIQSLNKFITDNYSTNLGVESERTTETGEKVGDVFTGHKQYNFSKFPMMYSSENNSDCLIHTILTATCPAFRRLSQPSKNNLATWVRLYVLPASPVIQAKFADAASLKGDKTVGKETKKRFFTKGVFLNDSDIGQIAMAFKLNFLMFENQESQQITSLTTASEDAASPDAPFYMIMNASGVHFESVQTDKGSYTIPQSLVNDINLIVMGDIVKEGIENMRDPEAIKNFAKDYQILLSNSNDVEQLKKDLEARIQEAIERHTLKSTKPTFDAFLKTTNAKAMKAAGATISQLRKYYNKMEGGRRWRTTRRVTRRRKV